MKVRLTPEAAADLDEAFDYVAAENPRAALALVTTILEAIETLPKAPFKGRIGKRPGTREYVIQRTNYVAVYQVAGDEITIARVMHGRRDWPPK